MLQKIIQRMKKITLQDVTNAIVLVDVLLRWFNQ